MAASILYVGTMMHVVVQGHRLLVDGGFQCVVRIRQGGQFVSHCYPPEGLMTGDSNSMQWDDYRTREESIGDGIL